MTRARILADYVSSGDELAVTTATADAALPKAGGAMTGAITTNSTFDGVDVGVRDGILTSTTTLATDAAPKASPAFTGTPTGITAAHLEAGELPSDVTGGAGLTALASNPTVTLGSNATFPAGMVRQIKNGSFGSKASGVGGSQLPNTISFDTAKLATSNVLICWYISFIPRSTTAIGTSDYGQAWLTGSNFGATTSGKQIQVYMAYYRHTFHDRCFYSGHVLDTNPTSAPAYGFYGTCQGGSWEINTTESPNGATIFEIMV